MSLETLRAAVDASGDSQLTRVCGAYLPLMYSRRHGDPSRPWNRFSIHLRGENGEPIYGYQGTGATSSRTGRRSPRASPTSSTRWWRFPELIDRGRLQRVSHQPPGRVDWEVPDPNDPWGHTGYWATTRSSTCCAFSRSGTAAPGELSSWLNRREYSYANVPYRIAGFDAILAEPHSTITFDRALHGRLKAAEAEIGADGKLIRTLRATSCSSRWPRSCWCRCWSS